MTTTLHKDDWEPLVETLRSELQEYGGLFNLLNSQQDGIIERRTDDVLALNDEIEAQTRAVADLRRRREELVGEIGGMVGVARPGRVRDLLAHLPEVVQPLFEALLTDINHMVRRNRQKARQNHLLLSRAMELTEQTLRVLQPGHFTRTYQRDGKVSLARTAAPATRYHAVG